MYKNGSFIKIFKDGCATRGHIYLEDEFYLKGTIFNIFIGIIQFWLGVWLE